MSPNACGYSVREGCQRLSIAYNSYRKYGVMRMLAMRVRVSLIYPLKCTLSAPGEHLARLNIRTYIGVAPSLQVDA